MYFTRYLFIHFHDEINNKLKKFIAESICVELIAA